MQKSSALLRCFFRPTALALVGLTALALGACSERPRLPAFDLEQQGQASLSASDPALLEAIETFVVLKFNFGEASDMVDPQAECEPLVDMSMEQLAAVRDMQGELAAEAAFAKGSSYSFGQIEPEGNWAFMLLGSVRTLHQGSEAAPPDAIDPATPLLEQLTGSVNAIGCRGLALEADSRHDLRIVMFPAGLR